MKPATLRAWSKVHTWSSLICTLFLLILALTGLPLVFHDEIDGMANRRGSNAGTMPNCCRSTARSPPRSRWSPAPCRSTSASTRIGR
jgi:hypothetical protein